MNEKPTQVVDIEGLISKPWSPYILNLVLTRFAEFELETTADFEEYVRDFLPARMVLLISSWNIPKVKVLRARYESLAVSDTSSSKEQNKSGSKNMVDERDARREYVVDFNLINHADEFMMLAGSLSFEGACSLVDKLLKDPEIIKSLSRFRSLRDFVVTTYNNTVAEKISKLYDRMSKVQVVQLGLGKNWLDDTPQGITTAVIREDASDPTFVKLQTLDEARKDDPEIGYSRAQQEQECLLQMRILTKMVGDLESTSSTMNSTR